MVTIWYHEKNRQPFTTNHQVVMHLFYKKNLNKKMNLKNPKTLRKY